MTETEWLECTDRHKMLSFVPVDAGSPRKLRLWAAACCRRVLPWWVGDELRQEIELGERLADGLCSPEVWEAQASVNISVLSRAVAAAPKAAAYDAPDKELAWKAESRAQAILLRDVFGNPFRPVAFDPAWRSPYPVALAETIYDHRAFNRMPELAYALEGTGCTDADLLAHCQEHGPHVRGCWVVDLVLGKK